MSHIRLNRFLINIFIFSQALQLFILSAAETDPIPPLRKQILVYIQTGNMDRIAETVRNGNQDIKLNSPVNQPLKEKLDSLIAISGRGARTIPPIPVQAFMLSYEEPRKTDAKTSSDHLRLFEWFLVIGPCQKPDVRDAQVWLDTLRLLKVIGMNDEPKLFGKWVVIGAKDAPWDIFNSNNGPADWFGDLPVGIPDVPADGVALFADFDALASVLERHRNLFIERWLSIRLIGPEQKPEDLKIPDAPITGKKEYYYQPDVTDFNRAEAISSFIATLRAFGEGQVKAVYQPVEDGSWRMSVEWRPSRTPHVLDLLAPVKPPPDPSSNYVLFSLAPGWLDHASDVLAATDSFDTNALSPKIEERFRKSIRKTVEDSAGEKLVNSIVDINGPVYIEWQEPT
jgi:hypothetical protein